ncbi:MAG: O-antigen ligase family protein [Anaerolineales bacterium]
MKPHRSLKSLVDRPSIQFGFAIFVIVLVAFRWISGSVVILVSIIDLIIGGIVLVTSLRVIKVPGSYPISILTGFVICVVFYRLVSSMFSPLPAVSIQVAFDGVILLLVFSLMLSGQIKRDTHNTKIWLNAFISSAILFALIDLLSAFIWYRDWFVNIGSFNIFPPINFRSPGSFLLHPNLLAGYLNIALPFLFLYLFQYKRWSHRLLTAAGTGILIAAIYFTSSRGAWLSSVASVGTTSILFVLPNLRATAHIHQQIERIRSRPYRYFIGLLIFALLFSTLVFVFINQASQTRHAPLFQSRQNIWNNAYKVFMLSPFWGNGPGSVRPLYASIAKIPPGFSAGHAHNLFLQLAGEMGVFGIVAGTTITTFLVINFFRSWKDLTKEQHFWMAGSAGALVSLFLHNQFDYLFEALPNVVGLLILFVIIDNHWNHSGPVFSLNKKHFGAGILALLLIGVLYHATFLKAGLQFSRGVTEEANENYSESRLMICDLLNGRFPLSHYSFQCGYAAVEEKFHAHPTKSLDQATEIVHDALLIDPYWPMHKALYANMQWLSGRKEIGLAEMQDSISSAPGNADLALNLGWMYEDLGNSSEAVRYYQEALEIDPWLRRSVFFNQTNLRQEVKNLGTQTLADGSSNSEAWLGWVAMEEGAFDLAETHFRNALDLSAFNYYAYTGLSYVLAKQGDQKEARYFFRSAMLFNNQRPITFHKLAKTATLLGYDQDAKRLMNKAFDASRWKSFSGEYLNSTYRRPAFPSDRTPFMRHADFTQQMVDDFIEYANLQAQEGNSKYANEIIKWITAEIDQPREDLITQ